MVIFERVLVGEVGFVVSEWMLCCICVRVR
jgi:hypothetical protein